MILPHRVRSHRDFKQNLEMASCSVKEFYHALFRQKGQSDGSFLTLLRAAVDDLLCRPLNKDRFASHGPCGRGRALIQETRRHFKHPL